MHNWNPASNRRFLISSNLEELSTNHGLTTKIVITPLKLGFHECLRC